MTPFWGGPEPVHSKKLCISGVISCAVGVQKGCHLGVIWGSFGGRNDPLLGGVLNPFIRRNYAFQGSLVVQKRSKRRSSGGVTTVGDSG